MWTELTVAGLYFPIRNTITESNYDWNARIYLILSIKSSSTIGGAVGSKPNGCEFESHLDYYLFNFSIF